MIKKIKARLACFFHGHIWQLHNDIFASYKIKCMRCGKQKKVLMKTV